MKPGRMRSGRPLISGYAAAEPTVFIENPRTALEAWLTADDGAGAPKPPPIASPPVPGLLFLRNEN